MPVHSEIHLFGALCKNTLYGEISAGREKKGLPVDPVDLMITAIAKYHNAAIATRNVKDFEQCGIKLINPWKLN